MLFITRLEQFNAAHRVFNPAWSREKNEAVFGICANPNFHGHNFDLYVTIKGDIDPETGYVFDARQLGKIVRDKIVSKVDHRNLNIDVDFMKNKICSTENFVVAIWHELIQHLPTGATLHRIKLCETSKIYIEYFG